MICSFIRAPVGINRLMRPVRFYFSNTEISELIMEQILTRVREH